MIDRRTFVLVGLSCGLAASGASAQFTGPSVQGQPTSVGELQNTRPGRYVVLEGNIVAHQRGDYYTFRDATGEIRVEIPSATFGGRQIGPTDSVRIMGELDTGRSGRYVWVKSLQTV